MRLKALRMREVVKEDVLLLFPKTKRLRAKHIVIHTRRCVFHVFVPIIDAEMRCAGFFCATILCKKGSGKNTWDEFQK